MRDIIESTSLGTTYNASPAVGKVGRKMLISQDSAEAQIIYHSIEGGLSTTQTVVLVNTHREARQLPSVSWIGLAKVRKSDGSFEGRKAPPFCYNGQTVVGPAAWKKLKQKGSCLA